MVLLVKLASSLFPGGRLGLGGFRMVLLVLTQGCCGSLFPSRCFSEGRELLGQLLEPLNLAFCQRLGHSSDLWNDLQQRPRNGWAAPPKNGSLGRGWIGQFNGLEKPFGHPATEPGKELHLPHRLPLGRQDIAQCLSQWDSVHQGPQQLIGRTSQVQPAESIISTIKDQPVILPSSTGTRKAFPD